jgi:tRNA pseudouridine38-40 synthase
VSRRIRLDLAYDGTDYAGWQVQPGQATIQSVLEQVLRRLNGDRRVCVRGAGRTDAGVHARQQVCDFLFQADTNDTDLAHALHRMLPDSIRPLRLRTVDATFHARNSARSKCYRYGLDRSTYGDPALARFALHCPQALDEEAMRDALARLPGRRDWSGFTGAACEVEDRVRTVTVAAFVDGERFEFEGQGFLTYMVRNIVGTVLEVGRGRRPAEEIDTILSSGDRRLAGPTAPARGLHLWSIRYDP